MRRLLAVVSVLGLSQLNASAKCAPTGLRPEVLSPDGTLLKGDDGIVVAAQDSVDDRTMPDHDVAVQKGWRFRMGKDLVEPKIVTIAPGLAIYQLPKGGTGDIVLEDDKHSALVKTGPSKDTPPELAAPKVKKIVATKVLGRRPSTEVAVTLDGEMPATAVAIVAANEKGKALSFGVRPEKGDPLMIYVLHRCQIVADGTVEPTAGMKVKLFWVSATGRKSPASKVVTITGTKPTKDID